MDENYGISKTIQDRTNKAITKQLIYSDSFPSKPNWSVIVVCTDTLNQRGNAPMYRTNISNPGVKATILKKTQRTNCRGDPPPPFCWVCWT